MKNIVFKPLNDGSEYSKFICQPKPASLYVPDWYKNMPIHMGQETTTGLASNNSSASNLTLKGCSPFLDALSFGYIYELPLDIEVKRLDETGLSMKWRPKGEFITSHTEDQFPGLPLPADIDSLNSVLKWLFPFSIQTPEEYSCIFTHPFNRHDLPFRTFTGVVDTDSYPGAVQFPFQWIGKVEERLILEQGTPVCQIIPIKRENWKSSLQEQSKEETEYNIWKLKSKIVRSYKNQWWNKKRFV